MRHQDHVDLLRPGIPAAGGTWADLGSGWGAFTLALIDLLGPEADLHSLDRDPHALDLQRREIGARFPQAHLTYHLADFAQALDLPPLDGAVIANALHFAADPVAILSRVRKQLRPGGRLIVVEYDNDRGNAWVPHPVSSRRLAEVASAAGFTETRVLASVPSHFLDRIYSGLCLPGLV